MPPDSAHFRISMIDGLRFGELRHEVSSIKKKCVMVCSLESRDAIEAEEKNERGISSSMSS